MCTLTGNNYFPRNFNISKQNFLTIFPTRPYDRLHPGTEKKKTPKINIFGRFSLRR